MKKINFEDVTKENIITELKVIKRYDFTKEIDTEKRQVKVIISTEDVDRSNDNINVLGWDFTNFLKNPTVLWAHDYSKLPIAKSLYIGIEGKNIVAICEFPKAGLYHFADTVYEMIKDGFINASSVGFKPKKFSYKEDYNGVEFIEQELLEFSFVPVPANPNALITSKSIKDANDLIKELKQELGEIRKDIEILKEAKQNIQEHIEEKQKTIFTTEDYIKAIKEAIKETHN